MRFVPKPSSTRARVSSVRSARAVFEVRKQSSSSAPDIARSARRPPQRRCSLPMSLDVSVALPKSVSFLAASSHYNDRIRSFPGIHRVILRLRLRWGPRRESGGAARKGSALLTTPAEVVQALHPLREAGRVRRITPAQPRRDARSRKKTYFQPESPAQLKAPRANTRILSGCKASLIPIRDTWYQSDLRFLHSNSCMHPVRRLRGHTK